MKVDAGSGCYVDTGVLPDTVMSPHVLVRQVKFLL